MKTLVLVASVGFMTAAHAPAQPVKPSPHKATVVTTSATAPPSKFRLQSKTVTPDCPTPWFVETVTLFGGKQEGSQLLVVNNGKMEIVLVPTRGMGILTVRLGGQRLLGWDSPVQEVVHPKFMNLQARGGLGWLEGFNEWLCRCGLENNGQAGKDEFINNMGDKALMDLTLHGKIANIPASEVEVVVEREPPYRIHVKSLVHERMLFGPKLDLRTTLTTEPGSTSFRITDEVINAGTQPEEFQMLYHFNFGKPLLEEGAKIVAAAKKVRPFNANAAKDVNKFNEFRGPTPGYVEQVYLFEPIADKQGQTTVLLHNKAKELGASLKYSLKELPYLTLWKNTGAEADGYVCGIEPGTNYPNNRRVERQFGRVPKLQGGASYTMTLDVGLHSGTKDVQQAVTRIAAIQGTTEMVIEGQAPPKKD